MSTLQVFDPPMCCATGVCGPTVDPDVVQFAADLDWLASRGVTIRRFNLAQEPTSFAENAAVKTLLARSNGARIAGDCRRRRRRRQRPLSDARRTCGVRRPCCRCRRWHAHARAWRTEDHRFRLLRRCGADSRCKGQELLLNRARKCLHEISRPATTLPLFHGQGRCRQNLDCLRCRNPACRSRSPGSSCEHRSGLQRRAGVWDRYRQPDNTHPQPSLACSRSKSTRRQLHRGTATALSGRCGVFCPTRSSRASRNSSPAPAPRRSRLSMSSPGC